MYSLSFSLLFYILYLILISSIFYFPGGSDSKVSAYNVGDLGSIPGSERSSGEGNGNPLEYSCLENPMNGGAWYTTVHGVAKCRTRLSDFTFFLSANYHWLEDTMKNLIIITATSF